jgi:hypothetical protein
VEDGINILIWQEKDWMTDPHIFSKLSDARKCSAIHGGYVLHFDTITYAGRNEKRI